MNRYCLSGYDDTILDFTKKDLIYLNELIENNHANQTILQEKNIIAPQEIQPNPTFCPDQTKTIFWPNVTNIQDMCQEANVVAIAQVKKGGKKGTFWYVSNGEVQKTTISDDGLRLNQAMQGVLNRTKIKEFEPNTFTGTQGFILLKVGNVNFVYTTDTGDNWYYAKKPITFPDSSSVSTITF